LELGGGSGEFTTAVASLIEQEAGGTQGFVDFAEAGADLFGFHLEQAFAGLTGVLLSVEVEELIGEELILILTLNLLGGGGVDLRAEYVDPLTHLGDEGLDTLKDGGGGAVAFLESRDASDVLRGVLGGEIAALLQEGESRQACLHAAFEFSAPVFGGGDVGFARGDDAILFGAFRNEAMQFGAARIEALADASHLGLELLEHVAGRHGLLFGDALLFLEAIEQGSVLLDFSAQKKDAGFAVAQRVLEFFQGAQDFAKFALHGKRTFRALLAAGDGHVVEALAGMSEEEGVGIFEGEFTPQARVRHDVTVAQFGQDDFERFAESIEDTNGALQGNDRLSRWSGVRGFIDDEGELGLRIFGMDQKCGAAIDVATEQAQAFVGGIPGFDDDVVEFVAEKVFDHALVLRFDFEEVGEHADRRVSALKLA
jgi:hypothetical protein